MVHKRRSRLLAIGVADLVVAGLSLGASVAVHPTRASAGTAGSGAVFVTTGTNGGTTKLQLDDLGAPGSPSSGFPASAIAGPIAINSTATLAVAGAGGASGSQINDVSVINVSTGGAGPSVTLPQTGDTPVGIAMDAVNPNVGYVVEQALGFGGAIDRLSLSGTSVAPSTLVANLPEAPNQIQVTPTSVAVTPDGGTVLVGFQTRDYLGVDSFSTSSGAWTGEWFVATEGLGRVADIAVSPRGQSVYVLTANQAFAASLPLPAPPAPNPEAPSSPSQWETALTTLTSGRSLTVSPDGSTVYAAGTNFPAGETSFVQALSASSGAIFATAPLSQLPPDSDGVGGVVGVADSPSGNTVLAYGFNASFGLPSSGQILVYPLTRSGSSLTAGAPHPVGSVNLDADGEVLGPESIAITPDQAPVASFSAVAGFAGSASTFDAGASTVLYGSIARYVWSFGDGATAVTSSPVVSHVYASPETYTVTLTETDSAGTSIPPAPGTAGLFAIDGAGQTASRRADQSASTQQIVAIVTPGTATTSPTTPSSSTTPTTPGASTTTPTAPVKSAPVLTLNPAVGPPGTIVAVTGAGFPKNTPITVSWSISTGSVVVTTDSHGNLPATQLYILTPDILGPRYAVASSTPPAKAPFLVVPSTSEPGGDAGVFLFRSEGP